jgi:hypothetical protein
MSVDDNESPDDGRDGEDAFDRRWSHLLDAEADLLRTYAERLLTTGSISIERAGGVLTAQFTGPVWRYHGFMSWHRRPLLDVDATAANGNYSGAHGAMVNKYRDRADLIREVMLQLAVSLAGLEEDAAVAGAVGYSPQPIWTEQWQSIQQHLDPLREQYQGIDFRGNFDLNRTVAALLIALSHLYYWLLHDTAVPLGKSALDAFVAEPGHAGTIGLCRAYAYSRKHADGDEPNTLQAEIVSTEAGPTGDTATIGYWRTSQPGSVSKIDALDLAERSERDWRALLTANGIPIPPR